MASRPMTMASAVALLAVVLQAAAAATADAAAPASAAAPETAAAPASTPRTGDPLQAPGCKRALAALQDAEAAAASAPVAASAAPPTVGARLAAARLAAARSCLASRTDPSIRGRVATSPIVVAPVDGVRAPAVLAAPPARVAIPVPPPGPPPLTSITSCDAAGCWASDGSRLNRVGPTLWGPRGACSAVGTVVHCP